MKLKLLKDLNDAEINALASNINTGIEHEYALFFLLSDEDQRFLFNDKIINNHPYRPRILSLIKEIDIAPIQASFKEANFTPVFFYLVTQEDSVGPSDIVALDDHGDYLGLSVKNSNNCQLNVSGKHFLEPEIISSLRNVIDHLYTEYVIEMTDKFKVVNNWFRKRRPSVKTNEIIDVIRDAVIASWSLKTMEEKKILLRKLLHADSPIKYFIVTFNLKRSVIVTTVRTDLEYNLDYTKTSLIKHQSSFIRFLHEDQVIGDMQVKFNNGILERGSEKNNFLTVDGVHLKKGSPFTSWNFSLK